MDHDHGNMSMPMPNSTYNNQSMMHMDPGMVMHMSFFWDKDVVLLFAGWPGSGRIGMYLLALVVIFLLAVAIEILSVVPSMHTRRLSPTRSAMVHAFVYGARMTLAYLVMLAVMSYNLGVLVVAVAGHLAGSFVVKYRELAASEGSGPKV